MAKCEDTDVNRYAGVVIRSFRRSDLALCGDKSLREYFRQNGYCWSEARRCVLEMLFDDNENLYHDCEDIPKRYDICLKKVPKGCLKHTEKYGKQMQTHLPCSSCSLIVSSLTVVLCAVLNVVFN